MYITSSPKDRRFTKSALIRSVPIIFSSCGSEFRLYVNVYRYPCGRLCFCVPCASFCFAPYLNNRCGNVWFQSVAEMRSFTCLPDEVLYSMLGVRPYGFKRASSLF